MDKLERSDIHELLDRLAELQAAPDAIRLKKQELIDQVLTPEIKEKLAEIEAEFSEPLQAAQSAAAELEAEIKDIVLKECKTIKGSYLMAVWVKGREGGWDNGKLQGFAMAHPEILAAKKPDGMPTVQIRRVG